MNERTMKRIAVIIICVLLSIVAVGIAGRITYSIGKWHIYTITPSYLEMEVDTEMQFTFGAMGVIFVLVYFCIAWGIKTAMRGKWNKLWRWTDKVVCGFETILNGGERKR